MSLATTCPQCKTSFKVVADQLKLRRGLVRCGVCQHVFSGLEFLKYVEETTTVRESTPESTTGLPGDDTNVDTMGGLRTAYFLPENGAPDTEMLMPDAPGPGDVVPPESITTRGALGDDDIDTTIPLTDTQPDTTGSDSDRTAASRARSDLWDDEYRPRRRRNDRKPEPPAARPGEFEELDPGTRSPVYPASFGEPQDEDAIDLFSQRTRPRGLGFINRPSPLVLAGAGLLILLLLIQTTLASRDWLASTMPSLRGGLNAMAAAVGKRVEAPRQLDALTIEAFELQASPSPDVLALSAILRNHRDHEVMWPALELTLTDTGGGVLVRKVLQPADYLRGQPSLNPRGIASGETPIRVALEARRLTPAGYSVVLFYP